MKEQVIKLNEKIFIHLMKTDKFKSNVIAAFLLTDLDSETVTKNALIPAVLRRGTAKLQTMKDISIKMDEMYGALFDASTDKIGDKQAIQLYASAINNKFTLNGEDLLAETLEFMFDAIYNPYLENGIFCEEYVNGEKETLRELINSKINNKGSYAMFRCTEETFGDDPYALFKYGNEADLEEITASNLYDQYQTILHKAEKHFYICGDVEEEKIKEFFENKYEKIPTTLEMIHEPEYRTKKSELNITEVKEVREKMDVTQGKLVLAYDVDVDLSAESFYKMTLYNTILGASSNSKLFQNVREKASLAYTTRSTYLKHKGVLFVTAGIELDKYEKALELIKIQVDDMRKGNFSDEDIKDAKVFLKNLFNSIKDDQITLVELSIGNFILGLDASIDEMIASFEKVTREDIVEVANKTRLVTNYYLCAE
ncbi:MAG: insulinase family protein [Clostridia bacterium]|nr:insulinase family protein [Clostridia bacterium]